MAVRFPVAMMFSVFAAGSNALPARIPEADSSCEQHEEVSCMLQFRTRAPEHVTCTYAPNAMCQGNQCCLGAPETGGLTYPCPSAAANFTGCENNTRPGSQPILGLTTMSHPLWWRRLLELHSSALEPEHTTCTYAPNAMCQGNQCCLGAPETGGLTYPCPSAAANFTGCENNTRPGSQPILGLTTMSHPLWWRRLLELHSVSKPGTQLERLQFFSEPADMEAAMATIARVAKATVVRTPNSLFGQRAKRVAAARVSSETVLFACHNPEQLKPEQQDHRFDDPAMFTLPKMELPSELSGARAMCHSVPKVQSAPEYMQYVLFEKEDGSRVRVMQECHSFSLVHEMCHTSELVIIDTDALRALDTDLRRAAGGH